MATKTKRRAIALAGGGPAAGLHIGALQRLEELGIDFQVWSLSCIGAWVGIVYHTRDGKTKSKGKQTEDFFRENIFRDDDSYAQFPVNRAFGPDLGAFARAWGEYMLDPTSYYPNLVLPDQISKAVAETVEFLQKQKWSNEGDRNNWWLNNVLAVSPASRFLTSLIYKSRINGLARIYYKDSSFLKSIQFEKLDDKGMPEIYHNAWNLTDQAMQIFHNKPAMHPPDRKYMKISPESLCACSALPFIEETVAFGGKTYCEGALIDTVNFKDLLHDHQDAKEALDEIWVNRIVDASQVKVPTDLADGLANLCQLFAAEVGENDIKLFRRHLRLRVQRGPRLVELQILPGTKVNFDWSHANLTQGIAEGKQAVNKLMADQPELDPRKG